jgi:hypothetical protein
MILQKFAQLALLGAPDAQYEISFKVDKTDGLIGVSDPTIKRIEEEKDES